VELEVRGGCILDGALSIQLQPTTHSSAQPPFQCRFVDAVTFVSHCPSKGNNIPSE